MEYKTIKQLPIARRKELREKINKMIEIRQKQNELLKELYSLPNDIAIKKSKDFLDNKICSEELIKVLDQTKKRYEELFKWRPR